MKFIKRFWRLWGWGALLGANIGYVIGGLVVGNHWLFIVLNIVGALGSVYWYSSEYKRLRT